MHHDLDCAGFDIAYTAVKLIFEISDRVSTIFAMYFKPMPLRV